uniref:E3 ubiquitin-protein ligase TRIM69-like isoform X2 n=1 Tax=Pogona vitticeps TaxID=103695 RepID=A0A6J0V922_9SAUR
MNQRDGDQPVLVAPLKEGPEAAQREEKSRKGKQQRILPGSGIAVMVEAFQQDLTCSICLDLFVEPVVLRCGHWFCRKCITSCWVTQEKVASFCPACRAPCPYREFQPNRLLGNLAKRAREIQEAASRDAAKENAKAEEKEPEKAREGGQRRQCCEVHGDDLLLFCTTDETCICSQCVNSALHTGHSFSSLKDGAETYKKLSKALEPLESRVKELTDCEKGQKEEIRSLKDSAASLRTNIEGKFCELHQALRNRKAAMLTELDNDEKVAHKDMDSHLQQIQESLRAAKEMLHQGKTCMARNNPCSFLVGIRPFLGLLRSQKETTPKGDENHLGVLCCQLSPGKFKGPAQHLAYRPLYPVFAQELESIQLDPKTAHPELIINDNGTSVCRKPRVTHIYYMQNKKEPNSETKDVWTVLGTTGFISGKHYWEIETRTQNQWFIGVSLESARGKKCLEDLKHKIWGVHQKIMKETSPDGPPRCRIGVYLAYEEGQVSFYNASDGSHLRSQRASFKEKVYPFFCHPADDALSPFFRICQK